MKPAPTLPDVDDAPAELFASGHLWILEAVDGAPLRFQLDASGLLTFGDRDRVYDRADAVPDPYRHAVRHVRERLDRDALRAAVDDVEDVVFFGVATHQHAVDYDWDRLPSFLGTDVWSAGSFRPPDVAHGIFEALDLAPITPIERELPARDFDPDSYVIPESAWYDGPAAGVVVRNKAGGRAKLSSDDMPIRSGTEDDLTPGDATADELADAYATSDRFDAAVTALEERGRPVAVDAVTERVFEAVVRRHHRTLYAGAESADGDALRSAIATRAQRIVG